MFTRKQTRKINIGNVIVGGQEKIILQSMTTTKTTNIGETVKEILELEKANCEIVRVACPTIEDARAIKEIKKFVNVPIVADVHFDHKIALEAIKAGADKIRINPGNIGRKEKVQEVVRACQEKNIPIRIGINAGSLEKHIINKYGYPTAEGMLESAMEHIKILEDLEFYDIIVSMKASDPLLCVEAYKLLASKVDYPLHLGVTESGLMFNGSIKSSVGLGILIYFGLGDTMRVSISDKPTEEIRIGKEILKTFHLYSGPNLISCPTCGRIEINLIKTAKEVEKFLETLNVDIKVSVLGCAVNGPGEAKEADIGIAGGRNEGLIYKKGEIFKKVPENKLVEELITEIKNMISNGEV